MLTMITVVVPTADQATGVGGTLLIPVPEASSGQGDPRRSGHEPVGAGEQADQHAQGADHRQQVRGRPEHRVTPERGVPERVGGRGRRDRDRRGDREGEPGSAEHGGQPPPPPPGDHDPDGEDRRIQQQVRGG